MDRVDSVVDWTKGETGMVGLRVNEKGRVRALDAGAGAGAGTRCTEETADPRE